MKSRDFAPYAEHRIQQGAAVREVTRVEDEQRPVVTRVTLATGAAIIIQWISTSMPTGGAPAGESDPVITGTPPEPVPVPELATTGQLRTADVEQYFGALLTNGGDNRIRDVTGYSADPKLGSPSQPCGLRIRFHDGSDVYGLFLFTLPPGTIPKPGSELNQREVI